MNLVPLIVCGGGGQRLWPKSRPALPKPFVALPDGGTLLARAYRRALAAPSLRAVITVAAADHGFLCAEEFRRAGGGAEHLFVGEPEGKNTAPAIAVGCELARARFGDDCVVAVLPADHLVDSDGDFWRAFAAAESRLAAGAIAVLGIAPTHAATGYGYIERGRALGEDLFAVARFVEKPDRARAESFLRDGGFFWNAGVFGFSAAAGCAAVARCAPSLAARAQKIAARFDGGSDLAADADLYRGFDSISFDYAVMEKIAADGETECAVAAARCGWSDIGSWRAFADAFGGARDGDGNAAIGDALWRDSSGCFAWSDSRLVAADRRARFAHHRFARRFVGRRRRQRRRSARVVRAVGGAKSPASERGESGAAALGILRGAARIAGLQSQAHRSRARRQIEFAIASASKRTLDDGVGRYAGDDRRADIRYGGR